MSEPFRYILLDARKYDDFGIGAYISQLLELPSFDSHYRFGLLSASSKLWFEFQDRREFMPIFEPSPKYSISEFLFMGKRFRDTRWAIVHTPHYTVPLWTGRKPLIVTIHDLIHLRFPECLPNRAAYYYAKGMMKLAVKKADVVLTDSETTKLDLIKLLKAPEHKIRVVPLFAPEFPEASMSAQNETPYLLYVGAFAAHKNVGLLLDMMKILIKEKKLDLKLKLKGDQRRFPKPLAEKVKATGLENHVEFVPFLSKADLGAVYRNAFALCLPSLYEGFGLPALEAMACGTPVVASDGGALPEVIGDAGLICPAQRAECFVEAIVSLRNSPSLVAALREKGYQRAGFFQKEKMLGMLKRVYDRV